MRSEEEWRRSLSHIVFLNFQPNFPTRALLTSLQPPPNGSSCPCCKSPAGPSMLRYLGPSMIIMDWVCVEVASLQYLLDRSAPQCSTEARTYWCVILNPHWGRIFSFPRQVFTPHSQLINQLANIYSTPIIGKERYQVSTMHWRSQSIKKIIPISLSLSIYPSL